VHRKGPSRFVEHRAQRFDGQLLEAHRRRSDARIVEKQVEPAETLGDACEEPRNGIGIAHVGDHGDEFGIARWRGAHRFVERFLAPSGKRDTVSRIGEGERNGAADAAARARHERRLSRFVSWCCGAHR